MSTDLTGLDTLIEAKIALTARKAIDMSRPEARLTLAKVLRLAFGTGADQADQAWWDRRVLAGGASETLDLAGALTNAFGATVTLSIVRGLMVINRSPEGLEGQDASQAEIRLGGATNEWQGPFGAAGDLLDVAPGGCLLIATPTADGWAVTAGTADELKIENLDGANAAVYDIVIVGESA